MENPPVKILLVEDNPGDAWLLRDLLNRAGARNFQVVHVETLKAALHQVTESEPDLILLDLSLPDAHGLETVTRVRFSAPDVPIVVLTGFNDESFALQAVREGSQDYLVKGQIDCNLLVRAMRYGIERQRLLSDRKRAAAEIQKLAAFVRFNPNPVFEFSSDGALSYFNDAAQAMAVALGKKHPNEILPLEAKTIVQECIASGQSRLRLETTLEQRTLSWSFYPIEACHVVHCYAADITDRQSLEAQLRQSQKLESVGKLAGGIAHDFNNLLTIIYGHASLLLQAKQGSADVAGCAKRIAMAAERATNLTRQLLMFSRKQPMQPRNLDLRQVIAGMVKMLKPILGEDITLQVEHGPGLPVVRADQSMMEQVIMNLAINARDAMPSGGTLKIRTATKSQPGNANGHSLETGTDAVVQLAVSDTGCGIAPEHLPHIFEPFFTTKESGRGTGLGLATVYGIIKQHNGWIQVTSEPGKSTTFHIYLPGSEDLPDASTPERSLAAAPRGSEVILLVEDEVALRELLRSNLESCGYKVLDAETGVAALAAWMQHRDRIDLLLTDVIMPGGITGWDLAERLRADKPTLRVILSSGYTKEIGGQEAALQKGFHFLPKPYRPELVAHVIRDCLDGKDARSCLKTLCG
ncbi:MAG: response regulator [Verrucomicrobia bacterium]|nr:response regulator [Verrucomicrobiota bacterium]